MHVLSYLKMITPSGLNECQGCRLISTMRSVVSDLGRAAFNQLQWPLSLKNLIRHWLSLPFSKGRVPGSKVPVGLCDDTSAIVGHCAISLSCDRSQKCGPSAAYLLISASLAHHPASRSSVNADNPLQATKA